MILYLEDQPGIRPEDLLARSGKQGEPSVRGPLIRLDASEASLDALENGQKLHIVGGGDGSAVAGRTPGDLKALLLQLGLKPAVQLKQIHLIAHRTGVGGADSYAHRLLAALELANLQIDEIKAPLGDVRCDAKGKIWVKLPDATEWQPSSPALNYYVGPRVQEKHRRPA